MIERCHDMRFGNWPRSVTGNEKRKWKRFQETNHFINDKCKAENSWMTDRQVCTKRSQTNITNTSSKRIVKRYNRKIQTNSIYGVLVTEMQKKKVCITFSIFTRRSGGMNAKNSKITGWIYMKLDIRNLNKTLPTYSSFCYTLRTGSFKLFKRPLPSILTILTL